MTITSSFNIISTDQLRNRVVGEVLLLSPHHSLQKASGQIFKDDVKGFPPPLIFASWSMRVQ
jgi:hypothetical protein